jgi:hypothetical protein
MPKKKPDEPEQSADDKALEHRVDVMMSTELAKVSALAAEKLGGKKPAASSEAKSEVKEDQKTAPKLSAKLLKGVEAGEASEEPKTPAEPPIVIALADEAKPEEPAPAPEVPESQPEPAPTLTPENDPLEDSGTDEAVDDIVAKEGDTILAVGDALVAQEQRTATPGQTSGPPSKHKWLWFLVLVVLAGTAIDVFLFMSR